MKEENQLWQSCLDNLSPLLTQEGLSILSPVTLHEQDGVWTLVALSALSQKQIERDYLNSIELALKKLTSQQNRKVKKVVVSHESPNLFEQKPVEKKTITFRSNLNEEFHFHNFIAGPSNDKAYAAAQRVGAGSLDLNPLIIYGGTGLGKSHLMHATGNALRNSGKRVLYITAETFSNDYIRSLRDPKFTIDDFTALYRNVDALLIDDVQFLSGKEKSQEEFFHTFNSLFDQKRQIILTCDRFPKEVEGLEQRLISRFGNGLNVSVVPPGFETRVAILQSKAQKFDFDLPNEIAIFVAENIASNVRELEGALKSIYAASLFHHRPLTIAEAQEAIKDFINTQNKQVTLANIQKRVAAYYNLSLEELLSASRKATVALPRQVAMALALDLTKHSTTEIGRAFGRDHTTVLHASNKIKGLQEKDSAFSEEYKGLVMILTG